MLEQLFKGLFDTELTAVISVADFLLCLGFSLLLGLLLALAYMYRTRYTKSFVVTLALLPAVVCVVIMMVNGNVGAGVAVAGAFSLVRFRSAQGNAREIASIFLAMAIGLAAGMGYVVLAAILFVTVAAVILMLTALNFGAGNSFVRILRITIPENLDYDGLFDDLFRTYLKDFSLEKVKTTNMGTLYELQYRVTLRDERVPKEFIDALRCRNGNLNIVCCRESSSDTL